MNHKSCLNCGHSVYEKFCGHCGQKISTKRLDWQYLWHDIPHSVFHFERGFFPTLWGMITKPGVVINEFLDGKRVKYFKPLTYLLILGTLAGIIYLKVPIYEGLANDKESAEFMGLYQELNSKYYNLITTALIPIYALLLWIFYRKEKNFVEIMTALFFVLGTLSLLSVINIFYFFFMNLEGMLVLSGISLFLSFGYQIWVYSTMFRSKKMLSRIFIAVLVFILTSAATSILAFVIAAVYMMMKYGMDGVNLDIGYR